MKINQSIVNAIMFVSLTIPFSVIAADSADVNPDDLEYSESGGELADCSANAEGEINLAPPLKETKVGEVSYISGGICISGVRQMKGLAKHFPLEIVLVEKVEGQEKEGYIADVNVKIVNAKDKLVLETSTEGPYLLVKLPDGKYKITAEYNYVVKTNRVNINNKKHERVVFLWPTKE